MTQNNDPFAFIQHNMPVDSALDSYMMELIAKLVNAIVTCRITLTSSLLYGTKDRFFERKQILERLEWYDEKTKRKFTLTWEERK